MSTAAPASDRERPPTAVMVHLSGPRRGRTQRLSRDTLRVNPAAAGGVAIVGPDEPPGTGARIATLHPSGASFELVVESDRPVWINGDRRGARVLESDDLIEIENGPVLRFRLYPPGVSPYKSLAEAVADCVDCARRDGRPFWQKLPGLLTGMVRDLSTQTSWRFRGAVSVALALLAGAVVFQFMQARDLEQRLAQEQERVAGLAELLRRVESEALRRDDFVATDERIAALEARSAAVGTVIAALSPSIVYIQGGYGFNDPDTGRPLRLVVGEAGAPLRLPNGQPMVTLTGNGPPVEVNFSGTAFIVHRDGLMLTNRHVAVPWEDQDTLSGMVALGLKPVMRRMIGYVSDAPEPFAVTLVGASDRFDVAVLSCGETARSRQPLKLADAAPRAGEDVIVLGYPAGIRALLARAGDRFVKELSGRPNLDIWGVARALSQANLIRPLASRGIVSQVSDEAIVYDAETTQGGSGGPVLSLKGEVIAINRAILPEFGGSNFGVPVQHARDLMRELKLPPSE